MSLTSSGRRALPECAKCHKHLRLNLNIAGDSLERLREMMLRSPTSDGAGATSSGKAAWKWLFGGCRSIQQPKIPCPAHLAWGQPR